MTPNARKSRLAHALRSLPGIDAAPAPSLTARAAPPDNALVRQGLARPTRNGFELTEKGALFLARTPS